MGLVHAEIQTFLEDKKEKGIEEKDKKTEKYNSYF